MTTTPLCRIFGVRHLSPAGAYHLQTILEEMKPTAILVEGPSDATDHVKHLVHEQTKPPVALLCYTKDRPVRSILYPLAAYSPEWAALTWGMKHKVETRLIDLPAAVFLELHQERPAEEAPEILAETPENEDAPTTRGQASEHTLAYLSDPWAEIARLCGDPDHETWWERHFEHTTDAASYIGQIDEFGQGLRSLKELPPDDENLIREAWMRRNIRQVLAKGHKPEKVLVVCGAFHASALVNELPGMTDEEFARLPKVEASITLMPYSYLRLSSQAGYGAGNHAPAYFEKLWEERIGASPDRLPARFLAELCHVLRKHGHVRSAAEVIEAVRLANDLAALHDSPSPTLRDLKDAAITCLGRGEAELIREYLHEVLIGSTVGTLPKGISRTAIQEDFYLSLEELFLTKFQKDEIESLDLDLRENRYVKSKDIAFRDLNRSTFFHRLRVLGIDFAVPATSKQQHATWKEVWNLRWNPESEIQLVENSLLGDSIEVAAAVKLSQQLGDSQTISQSAEIVKKAAECELIDALENARRRLQAMAIEETNFVELASACSTLSELLRYGSVRKIDLEGLKPLLSQLFLRAVLGIRQACLCDDATGRDQVRPAMLRVHDVALHLSELVDGNRWMAELDYIASADNLNAYLSGFVMSLIQGRISEERLAAEVSRRLSPGVPPELGANWFEGMMQYNPQALLERLALWRQLDLYLCQLDEEAFTQALVPLRRAFGTFSTGQVRRVVSNLVEVSPEGAEELKRSVDLVLDEGELLKLKNQLEGLDLTGI